jgi:hypothetical protein
LQYLQANAAQLSNLYNDMWVNHYGGITAHYDPKVSDYPLFTAHHTTLTPRAPDPCSFMYPSLPV